MYRIEISSVIGGGWSGVVFDDSNGNQIIFGCYENVKGYLVFPTLYYFRKGIKNVNSDYYRVISFIKENKPKLDINPYYLKRPSIVF